MYTILLVEDDPQVRWMLEDLFRDAGFEVVVARDGPEALRLCAKATADLLFTDIQMPNLSGWDLAERCREAHPDMKVVYYTAYSAVPDRPVVGSVILDKPLRNDQVVAAVRRLLG